MLALLCFAVVMCTSETPLGAVLDTIKKSSWWTAAGCDFEAFPMNLSVNDDRWLQLTPSSQSGLPLLFLLCYLRLQPILIFIYLNTARATKELT